MADLLSCLDAWYVDPKKGGKGEGKKPSDFDLRQLLMGIYVELEHTVDPMEALSIAIDHLSEDEKYYDELKKIHKEEAVTVDFFGLPIC